MSVGDGGVAEGQLAEVDPAVKDAQQNFISAPRHNWSEYWHCTSSLFHAQTKIALLA